MRDRFALERAVAGNLLLLESPRYARAVRTYLPPAAFTVPGVADLMRQIWDDADQMLPTTLELALWRAHHDTTAARVVLDCATSSSSVLSLPGLLHELYQLASDHQRRVACARVAEGDISAVADVTRWSSPPPPPPVLQIGTPICDACGCNVAPRKHDR